MNGAISWREHQHVQVFTDEAKRLEAPFFVVFPCVFNNERIAPIEVFSQREWQATLSVIAQALGRIVSHSHCVIVPTTMEAVHHVARLGALLAVRYIGVMKIKQNGQASVAWW
jgi:hypothetical protein